MRFDIVLLAAPADNGIVLPFIVSQTIDTESRLATGLLDDFLIQLLCSLRLLAYQIRLTSRAQYNHII